VTGKDFVKVSAMSTSDFVIYEDGKVWTNDSVFHNIQYHEPFSVAFTLTDFRCSADGRLGYCNYTSHAAFVVDDTVHFQLNFIETAVFRKTADCWKLSLLHITELKTPEVGMPRYYRQHDTVRYIPEHYAERVRRFKAETVPAGKTIFLGNS